MFSIEELVKRGWSEKGINLYIGKPDKKVVKEGVATLFYNCKRVIMAEQFVSERNCKIGII